MAYDLDFRRRAVLMLEEGFTLGSVSELLDVGTASLTRWKQRAAQDNLAVQYPKLRGAYKIDDQALKAHLEAHPDAYLSELAEVAGGTAQGIKHALGRLGITRKKRHRNTAKETKKSVASLMKH